MIVNYKSDLLGQSKFIPIYFAQQIITATFEYALSHIVDKPRKPANLARMLIKLKFLGTNNLTILLSIWPISDTVEPKYKVWLKLLYLYRSVIS